MEFRHARRADELQYIDFMRVFIGVNLAASEYPQQE